MKQLDKQDELGPHENLSRLLLQIKEHAGNAIELLLNQQSIPSVKLSTIIAKLVEFRINHWKIYDESQINQMVKKQKKIYRFEQQKDSFSSMILESKDETLNLKAQRGLYEYEIAELKTGQGEVQITLFRPRGLDRFWYLALVHYNDTNQYNQTFDFQVNLINVENELSTIQKIELDHECIIIKKLNTWFRTLYFTKVSSKISTNENISFFIDLLNYIKKTMDKLFGDSNQHLICSKCRQCLILNKDPKEGFQIPYILFENAFFNRQGEQMFKVETLIFHDSCFLDSNEFSHQ